MKPWIKLAVVVVLASSTAVWADVDFLKFEFNTMKSARKTLKRSFADELEKVNNVPTVVATEHQTPLPKLAQTSLHQPSDDRPQVAVRLPVVLPEPLRLIQAQKTNVAEVRANISVEHHDIEPGLKLVECDREINIRYPDPPLVLECIAKDDGTRYVAKSNRTERDGAYLWNYK